ncbi:MAG TPA: glycosyltransferase family 39 protein [Candidatus Solibacter sp.]|nr:glycosyltransferase family 39 protein [Candidatus Solibacter sp.]
MGTRVSAVHPSGGVRQQAWSRTHVAALAATVLVLVAVNAWWIARYRGGGPLDIDEAGYLSTAVDHLGAGGPGGVWRVFQAHAPSAPLVPLAAAGVLALLGANVYLGFSVLIFALAVTVACSYALARRLSGPAAGAVAAVVVAGTPALLDYTRTFQFAVPVTAFFTAAVLCLVMSRSLQGVGWSLAWGGLIGLMLLSRTMTVAFLPGLIAAGLLVATRSPRPVRSIANLAGGLAMIAAVSGTWYLGNWQAVFFYLTTAGYGAQSSQYGSGTPFSPDALVEFLHRTMNEYLYLPLGLVFLGGVLAGGALTVIRLLRRSESMTAKLGWFLDQDHVPVAIPPAAGLLALVSSRNAGTGFIAPLLPAAVVLAVVALAKLPWLQIRRWALTGAVAIGVFGIAAKSGLPPFDGAATTVQVPFYGYAVIADPAGPIQLYEQGGGFGDAGLSRPTEDAAWRRQERQLALTLASFSQGTGAPTVCAFGFRDRFFNPNTLGLEADLATGARTPALWLEPLGDGSTVADVHLWLVAGAAKGSTALLTAGPSRSEIPPAVDEGVVEEAARAAGFFRVTTTSLPNGRQLTLWRRTTPPTSNPYPIVPNS